MSAPISVCGNLSVTDSNFKWEIGRSYLACEKVGEYLTSPVLYALNATWQIMVYPRGIDEDCKNHTSIFLQLLTCAKPVKIYISIAMLDVTDNDHRKYSKNVDATSTSECICISKTFVPYDHVIDIANYTGYLTLACEFSPHPNARLLEPFNFGSALNNQQYSDVKFTAEGKSIYAHKIVLTNKSKVFAAMFEHQMKENINNVVEIEDVAYDVMLELFRYIYSGFVNDIEKIAKALLVAADKYDLTHLKTDCIEQLEKMFTVDNVKECIDLAERHNVQLLKQKATDFIIYNADKISNTPNCKMIVESHPDVAVEVFRRLSERRSM